MEEASPRSSLKYEDPQRRRGGGRSAGGGIAPKERRPKASALLKGDGRGLLPQCGSFSAWAAASRRTRPPSLPRALIRNGHEVHGRFWTRAAEGVHSSPHFCVTSTGRKVITGPLFLPRTPMPRFRARSSISAWRCEHDLLLIAPATANVVGKLALGLADDFLFHDVSRVSPGPVVIAPAMNSDMWEQSGRPRQYRDFAQTRAHDRRS